MQNYIVELQGNKKTNQQVLRSLPKRRRTSTLKKGSQSQKNFSNKEKPSIKNITPRILLVDDNRINRIVNQTFLKNMGFQVECAVDGMSALAKDIGSFTLVLLDIGLPDMSGIELCKKIRAKETSESKIPIFFYTAFDITQKINECLAAGGNDVLQKPMSEEQMRKYFSAWLTKK